MNKYLECLNDEANRTFKNLDKKPRKIIEGTFSMNLEKIKNPTIWTERLETPEEVEKRIEETKNEHYAELDKQLDSEPLYCNICQDQIGYVYEFDLQGSKFYCSNCINH